MKIDALELLSDGQTLTATGPSTNVYDSISDRNIGIGTPLVVAVNVIDAEDDDSDETYKATLQTSDAEGFGSGVVSLGEVTITRGTTGRHIIGIPKTEASLRYFRLNYTLGGTTPSLTVDAWIAPQDGIDAGPTYKRGYKIGK